MAASVVAGLVEDEEEPETQVRFGVAQGFNFPNTVNEKLSEAMHRAPASRERAESVKDLDILLSCERDPDYEKQIAAVKGQLLPDGKDTHDDYEAYSDHLLVILLALMKRKRYTGGTDADYGDEF